MNEGLKYSFRLLPFLLLGDKKKDSTDSDTIKPVAEYQAACNALTDIKKKIDCLGYMTEIYTCDNVAKSISIGTVSSEYDKLNESVNNAAGKLPTMLTLEVH